MFDHWVLQIVAPGHALCAVDQGYVALVKHEAVYKCRRDFFAFGRLLAGQEPLLRFLVSKRMSLSDFQLVLQQHKRLAGLRAFDFYQTFDFCCASISHHNQVTFFQVFYQLLLPLPFDFYDHKRFRPEATCVVGFISARVLIFDFFRGVFLVFQSD